MEYRWVKKVLPQLLLYQVQIILNLLIIVVMETKTTCDR